MMNKCGAVELFYVCNDPQWKVVYVVWWCGLDSADTGQGPVGLFMSTMTNLRIPQKVEKFLIKGAVSLFQVNTSPIDKFTDWRKSIIFWDVTSCSLAEVYRTFEVTYCFHLQGQRISRAIKAGPHQAGSHSASWLLGLLLDPEDGGSTFLRNVGKLLPDYITSHPRRWNSSESTPRERQISLIIFWPKIFTFSPFWW
jgi:hypothetical protein